MRRLALTMAVLLTAPVLFVAAPAHAATIAVTTTLDVVDGGDGLVSLREAITSANTAIEATTIDLAAGGPYSLDLCGADEDANAHGDLDYTAAQVLTIMGNASIVQQTCANQRVLHAINGAGGVVVEALTVSGGAQTVGAAIAWANDLDLNNVAVMGNNAGAGAVLSSDDAYASGPTLDLVGSTVGPNTGTGVRISFGTVTISGSILSGNTLRAVGLIDGALSVSGSVVQDNGTGGLSTTGQGEGLLTVAGTQVKGNGGPGVTCSACGSVEILSSVISGNAGGVVVNVDQDEPDDELHVTVFNSTVAGNVKAGSGAGLGVFIIELSPDAPAAQISLDRSTFSGNSAEGMDARGGAVFASTGEVRIDNSTLDANSATATGGGVFTQTGDVFLRHATVTGNSAPTGANIGTGEDLNAFGSIVASASGGGTDCAIAGTTISSGYNVGGDASCAFVGGPGDQSNVGDPQLGPLQDNSGTTLTRVPLTGSPAEGAVPAAACTVLLTDQRGVTRPQGTACEAGAVEVAAPANGGLPVTGAASGAIAALGAGIAGFGVLLLVLGALRRKRRAG